MKAIIQKLIQNQKYSESVIREKVDKLYLFNRISSDDYTELNALIQSVYHPTEEN